jgi:hypothetical protein
VYQILKNRHIQEDQDIKLSIFKPNKKKANDQSTCVEEIYHFSSADDSALDSK